MGLNQVTQILHSVNFVIKYTTTVHKCRRNLVAAKLLCVLNNSCPSNCPCFVKLCQTNRICHPLVFFKFLDMGFLDFWIWVFWFSGYGFSGYGLSKLAWYNFGDHMCHKLPPYLHVLFQYVSTNFSAP